MAISSESEYEPSRGALDAAAAVAALAVSTTIEAKRGCGDGGGGGEGVAAVVAPGVLTITTIPGVAPWGTTQV